MNIRCVDVEKAPKPKEVLVLHSKVNKMWPNQRGILIYKGTIIIMITILCVVTDITKHSLRTHTLHLKKQHDN